jgi:ribosome biogenesis GTPase / thiamine phosphate phosphatase
MIEARVIKIISNHYTVETVHGEILQSMASGKLRKSLSPMVGDWVDVLKGVDLNVIERVRPRTNRMIRPLVANVDVMLIVMSTVKPEFSEVLVDRLSWLIRHAGVQPALLVSKWDLLTDPTALMPVLDAYRQVMPVFIAGKGLDNDAVLNYLKGKIAVLTGQSGVGKSSLINRIDPRFELHTQEISKALGRGKHTTRHVELLPVGGGWIADTPGFSSLDFDEMSTQNLLDAVVEFTPLASHCRFRNCQHVAEPGCAVKAAIDANQLRLTRYEHYLDIRALIEARKEY